MDNARFPGPASEYSSGVEDFWARAETDIANHPDPARPVNGEILLPERTRETEWPVHDPEAPDISARDERPELPRRRRQQNLAPQLATDEPYAAPTPLTDRDVEKSAKRTRDGLSAFQQGARDARGTTDNALEP